MSTFVAMKYFYCAICLFLLSLPFVFRGCGAYQAEDIFTEVVYAPKYASGFSIVAQPESQSRVVRVTSPWQGASGQSFDLLILRDGESAPENFAGQAIKSDAKRVITLSSSTLAMFERLGEVDRVVGVSGINYITSARTQERYDEDLVEDVGHEADLNYELIVGMKPDLVLLYSIGGGAPETTSKLKELGIPYIYIGEYVENSPLAKAEWMVVIGEICGLADSSIEEFNTIAKQYNSLKESVLNVESRPRIMLNTPYQDVWYMPSTDNYIVQLIEDAGGEYVYRKNRSGQTRPISIEEAYVLVSQVDMWLNLGASIDSINDLKAQNPNFANVDVVRKGAIYNNTARRTPFGGSDFWESGVVQPEVVLRDLITIMQPSVLSAELYYYKKLE